MKKLMVCLQQSTPDTQRGADFCMVPAEEHRAGMWIAAGDSIFESELTSSEKILNK